VYPLDLRRPHTRSPNLLRDAHVNGASAPVELDCQSARILRSDQPAARDASGQLVHSTLSKTSTRTACGCQPARGWSTRPELHGHGLASAGLPETRSDASHTELTPQGPTSDALVTGRLPRLSPGPPSDQYRFRLRLVKSSGFRDTGRLQPASSPPRALRFSPRARHPAITLDVFSPLARSFGLGPCQPRRPQPPWPI
jgi:hypothetical protein